jgi:hypothetical protein
MKLDILIRGYRKSVRNKIKFTHEYLVCQI